MARKRNSDSLVNMVCTVVFFLFTFFYLLVFQNDMLAYAQFYLSDGATTYNSFVGAVVIIAVLAVVSSLSAKLFLRNFSFLPSLYHLPSLLVLASITDIHIVGEGHDGVFGNNWIVAIVIFILFLVLNVFAKNVTRSTEKSDITLQGMWTNLFLMFAMLSAAVLTGNTDERDHVRLCAERLLSAGHYAKAVELMENHNVNSSELTMLKAFALAKTGDLGEKFFESRIVAGSQNLLPSAENRLLMLPSLNVYRALGAVPGAGMTADQYFSTMRRDNVIRPKGREYQYISCLVDRKLDEFVKWYAADYDSTTVVRKHYMEAITLYNSLHGSPLVIGKDTLRSAEMDSTFVEFRREMDKKYPEKNLRENSLRDNFGGTYWFYYYFTASSAFSQSVSREN